LKNIKEKQVRQDRMANNYLKRFHNSASIVYLHSQSICNNSFPARATCFCPPLALKQEGKRQKAKGKRRKAKGERRKVFCFLLWLNALKFRAAQEVQHLTLSLLGFEHVQPKLICIYCTY
jgi:hypothetical protein